MAHAQAPVCGLIARDAGRIEQPQAKVQSREKIVLHDNGATHPAGFFVVATECSLGRPHAMRQPHSELYAEMNWYYQQNPVPWLPVRPPANYSASAADG